MLNEMICYYRKSTFQYLDIFKYHLRGSVQWGHQSGQGVRLETAGADKVSPG